MVVHSSGTPIKFTDIEDEFGVINGTNTRKLGSYRISETYGGLTTPLDSGVPQSGAISFSDFYSKRLNLIVNYYDGANETRITPKSNYDSDTGVSVVGPGNKSRPTNTGSSSASGGSKVIVHVNKAIGSVQGTSDSEQSKCALRTGEWDSGTQLEINVGGSGKILGGGGNGGRGGGGGNGGNDGNPGFNGTSALGIQYSGTSVVVQNNGVIQTGYGGGGGGAGTKKQNRRDDGHAAGGGGGGGAGFPAGAGGEHGPDGEHRLGCDGSAGTVTTGTDGSLETAEGGEGGAEYRHAGAHSGPGGDGAVQPGSENTEGGTGGDSSGSQTGSGKAGGDPGSAIRKSADAIGYTLTIESGGVVTGEQANTSASSGGTDIGVA